MYCDLCTFKEEIVSDASSFYYHMYARKNDTEGPS